MTLIPYANLALQRPTTVSELLKRSKCTGTSQECEKPSDLSNNTTVIVVAVVLPVFACIVVIGYFMWRNYKKGKEEALDDNDPDFNADNTMLPDYDMDYYPRNGGAGKFGNVGESSGTNPFNEDDNLKYPSNVYSNVPKNESPYNQSTFFSQDNGSTTNTVKAHRYVDSFVLPYGEQTGSKRSLDEYARGIGVNYNAYNLAHSPDNSRASSMQRSVHPFSRSTDVLSRSNLSNVASPEDDTELSDMKVDSNKEEKFEIESSSMEDETHFASRSDVVPGVAPDVVRDAVPDAVPDVAAYAAPNAAPDAAPVVADVAAASRPTLSRAETAESEIFQDTHSQIAAESRPLSATSVDTSNLVGNLDTTIAADSRNSYVSNAEDQLVVAADVEDVEDQATIDGKTLIRTDDDEDEDDPSLTAEEREKLRRMKSIYNVYFDRENSIKHKNRENKDVVLPPLPALPGASGQVQDVPAADDAASGEDDEGLRAQNLAINTDFDRNYASSIYPENPLNDYEPYQQYQQQQQQYQQQQYQQQYPPQGGYYAPQPQQYAAPQGGYYPPAQQQGGYYPPSPQSHQRAYPQAPRQKPSLGKLNALPTPRELNSRPFSSVDMLTDYQPRSAFKASSSPKVSTPPQGFNPMDQWEAAGHQPAATLTPTAISRNSVAMTNPTAIVNRKAYKPAGSIAVAAGEYARNSPMMVQSPTFGSAPTMGVPQSPISMQSPNMGQYQSPTVSEFGYYSARGDVSRNGSRNDLRAANNGNIYATEGVQA